MNKKETEISPKWHPCLKIILKSAELYVGAPRGAHGNIYLLLPVARIIQPSQGHNFVALKCLKKIIVGLNKGD